LLPIAGLALPAVDGCRLKPVFQIIANRTEEQFVGPGMKASHAPELILFFDHAQPAFAGLRIEEQHADIHPLVADQVRCVPQNAVGAGSF